jgi:hypothetical protein
MQIGLVLSLTWVAHICVYMLPPVPLSPVLNAVFVELDNVFSLLGVSAFAGFCLYLVSESPRPWGGRAREARGPGMGERGGREGKGEGGRGGSARVRNAGRRLPKFPEA